LEKPHLAEYIKTFNAQIETDCIFYQKALPRTISHEECIALGRETEGFTWDSWEQWDLSFIDKRSLDLARFGRWDGAASYLLCHLPNLRAITLSHPGIKSREDFSTPFPCFDNVLTRAIKLQDASQISSPAALANLQEITIIGDRRSRRYPTISDIELFLLLESVKLFTCQRIKEDPDNLSLFTHFKHESSVTNLTIRSNILPPKELARFLCHFPDLRHFRLENGTCEGRSRPSKAPIVLRGVLHREKCVPELLGTAWDDDAEEWFDWATKVLSKAKDLKNITLSSRYFLGPFYERKKVDPLLFNQFLQAMPQSLEEVTLLGCLPHMLWPPCPDY
jgi:hypothetical protein